MLVQSKKILSVLRQKHQVVHDHYSFESLKTTGSSTTIQLSKIYPRGNEGSLVPLASWSSTSTMSMLKLPNTLSMSVDISLSLLQIAPRLMKPTERKVWLNVGISILALSFSFSRKLAILFLFFSSENLCLPHLSGLYPNPNRSLFWIIAIGFSMPCNLLHNPFPTRAPLPSICFMPEWVISESFGMKTFDPSPTYIALTNSRDLNEHSIVFSSVSTYATLLRW